MASRNNPFPDRNPLGRPEFWTEKRIDALIVKLKKHAANKESYDVLEFRADNDLTYSMITMLVQKSSTFREAYETAKAKIGSRRQKMALTAKWNAGMVQRDDWAYTPELLEYNREMKKQEVEAGIIPAQLAAKAKIEEQDKQIKELLLKVAELTK